MLRLMFAHPVVRLRTPWPVCQGEDPSQPLDGAQHAICVPPRPTASWLRGVYCATPPRGRGHVSALGAPMHPKRFQPPARCSGSSTAAPSGVTKLVLHTLPHSACCALAAGRHCAVVCYVSAGALVRQPSLAHFSTCFGGHSSAPLRARYWMDPRENNNVRFLSDKNPPGPPLHSPSMPGAKLVDCVVRQVKVLLTQPRRSSHTTCEGPRRTRRERSDLRKPRVDTGSRIIVT